MLEERAPARLILLRPLANAKNLPITALVHADRHQQRDVAHLARPAALEHDAVEIEIGMLALDRLVPPRLDLAVDLLVEVGNRARAHSCALQRLCDVLHAPDRHPGEVHLDQRFLHLMNSIARRSCYTRSRKSTGPSCSRRNAAGSSFKACIAFSSPMR